MQEIVSNSKVGHLSIHCRTWNGFLGCNPVARYTYRGHGVSLGVDSRDVASSVGAGQDVFVLHHSHTTKQSSLSGVSGGTGARYISLKSNDKMIQKLIPYGQAAQENLCLECE